MKWYETKDNEKQRYFCRTRKQKNTKNDNAKRMTTATSTPPTTSTMALPNETREEKNENNIKITNTIRNGTEQRDTRRAVEVGNERLRADFSD